MFRILLGVIAFSVLFDISLYADELGLDAFEDIEGEINVNKTEASNAHR